MTAHSTCTGPNPTSLWAFMPLSPPPDDRGPRAEARTDDVRYDWGLSLPPSLAVVETVAAVTGRSQTELPPLAEVLDTDALDNILTRAVTEADSPVRVSFSYAGTRIEVDNTGEIAAGDDASQPDN